MVECPPLATDACKLQTCEKYLNDNKHNSLHLTLEGQYHANLVKIQTRKDVFASMKTKK